MFSLQSLVMPSYALCGRAYGGLVSQYFVSQTSSRSVLDDLGALEGPAVCSPILRVVRISYIHQFSGQLP